MLTAEDVAVVVELKRTGSTVLISDLATDLQAEQIRKTLPDALRRIASKIDAGDITL